MNKILLIIKREYLSRVKKRSFIIMTLLGPLLMAGIMIVPVWLAMKDGDQQKIQVIDESMMFHYESTKDGSIKVLIPEKPFVRFDYAPITLEQAKAGIWDTDYDAILWIPRNLLNGGNLGIKLLFKEQMSVKVEQHIEYSLSKMLYETMLAKNNVNLNHLKDAKDKSAIKMYSKELDEQGREKDSDAGVKMGLGFVFGIVIYFLIFLYGVQVMRGVMEEKTSRIVEVILSSVKPFQLMMGKIVGVALVGLTQFLLWVLLTAAIYGVMGATVLRGIEMNEVQSKEKVISIGENLDFENMGHTEQPKVFKILAEAKNLDISEMLTCFVFYFLLGYLMYSALFAAVGSAVDSESDTNQFMLPITAPLILSIAMVQVVIMDPNGSIAFWFSMIPLTSPIVMMVRIPFGGVHPWEVILSISLLLAGFLFTTWLAARIYRTGILMYGKKASWRELGKWLFYKG